MYVNPERTVEPLPKIRGAALGMFPDQRFDEGHTTLPAGAALFLYTDGVIEATSLDKTELGATRLSTTLASQASAAPATMLAAVLNAVDDFASGTPKPDDMTLLVVRTRRDRAGGARHLSHGHHWLRVKDTHGFRVHKGGSTLVRRPNCW